MKRIEFVNKMLVLSFLTLINQKCWYSEGLNPKMIGACDWALGHSLKPEAFNVAKSIGLAASAQY